MKGHECYHCKQWIDDGVEHDCWTTTEAALTRDLSEDLRDAWQRLRETAAAFGEQRIYASHNSIMFSRKSCYFFVRPKRSFLEVCVFLGRTVKAPQIRRVVPGSKTKVVHVVHVRHRDEVEAPFTGWLEEAYAFNVQPMTPRTPPRKKTTKTKKTKETRNATKTQASRRAARPVKRQTKARKTAASAPARRRSPGR